jgi:hypothetical protein
VQIIGAPYSEAVILRVAAVLESQGIISAESISHLILGFVVAVEASLSSSGNRFALLLFQRGFKVAVLSHVGENSRFGNLSLEPSQG